MGLKISWIRALYNRAKRICSTESIFLEQLSKLRLFMSWNGFPRYVSRKLIKKFSTHVTRTPNNEELETIWLRLPYAGMKGECLIKTLTRKLKRCFKTKAVKFTVLYQTNKVSAYCSTKDKLPREQLSNLIYKIKCPGCGSHYIGKTDRNFITRMKEQGSRDYEPMYRHLSTCSHFEDMINFCRIGSPEDNQLQVNHKLYVYNAVLDNCEIIQRHDHWSYLCFLEAYYIKLNSPMINCGLRASKELALFK